MYKNVVQVNNKVQSCIYVDVQECSTGEQEGTEWVNLGEMIMVYI
jgi:hypothetical protein